MRRIFDILMEENQEAHFSFHLTFAGTALKLRPESSRLRMCSVCAWHTHSHTQGSSLSLLICFLLRILVSKKVPFTGMDFCVTELITHTRASREMNPCAHVCVRPPNQSPLSPLRHCVLISNVSFVRRVSVHLSAAPLLLFAPLAPLRSLIIKARWYIITAHIYLKSPSRWIGGLSRPVFCGSALSNVIICFPFGFSAIHSLSPWLWENYWPHMQIA